jgi:hypothetical protein
MFYLHFLRALDHVKINILNMKSHRKVVMKVLIIAAVFCIWINSENDVSKNLADGERNYGRQERQLSLNLGNGKCKW